MSFDVYHCQHRRPAALLLCVYSRWRQWGHTCKYQQCIHALGICKCLSWCNYMLSGIDGHADAICVLNKDEAS